MKKVFLISMIIAGVIVMCLALQAQVLPDSTRNSLINAPSAKRAEVRDMVQKNYPSLQRELYLSLAEAYPGFTTRFLKSQIRTLKKMDGKALSRLYLDVAGDLEKSYEGPAKEFRKEVKTLLTEKYSAVPEDFKKLHEENGLRKSLSAVINEKYPQVATDCLTIMKDKYPGLSLTIARDAIDTALKKDPTLFIEMRIEARSLAQEKYPEVLSALSTQERGPRHFREIMKQNPKFAGALFERIDGKFHSRIKDLRRTVIAFAIEKHSSEVLSFTEDVLTMVEKKYPDLPRDLVLAAGDWREKHGKEFKAAHEDFFKDLRAARDKNFPRLLADAVASIDTHSPGFRESLRKAAIGEFPDIEKKVKSFVDKKCPRINEEILKIIK
ncbi:MAG: hypothetical protein RDV48_06220 [Candidatus Eremiobacteraeota bacterium]|nr:hypothetical protein [Candidatus Eremiobacteraeota bacterium]